MLTPISIARSGFIASGNVGNPHIASGAIESGQLGITAGTPDGTKFLRDDFSWQTAGAGLTSGAVASGLIASGSVQGFFGTTRHIASGTVGVFDLGSGAVVAGTIGSGSVVSGNVGSGQIGRFHVASGQLAGFELGSGSIVSGRIASGQIGTQHLSSGIIQSGFWIASGSIWGQAGPNQFCIASGTITTNDLGSGAIVSGLVASGQIGPNHLASGSVGSGRIASGSTQGFFGTTRQIASGTIGVFDFGSGAIVAGTLGSGSIVSGNIASGQIGPNHLASGSVGSGTVASGTVQGFFGTTRNISSGTVGSFDLGSGAVVAGSIGSGAVISGNIGSGQVGNFALSSGSVTSGRLGITAGTPNGTLFLRDDFSWQAVAASITSGSVGSGAIASGTVQGYFGITRHIASGTVGAYDFASGLCPQFMGPFVSGTSWTALTEETVSGIRAVAISQSGRIRIAKASVSGLMPAIGIVVENVLSGIQCNVFTGGVFQATSGLLDFSGYLGQLLSVGRSGSIVTNSGSFNSGGLLSGDITQPIGMVFNSGAAVIEIAAALPFVPGLVTSGNIASGNIDTYTFASGATITKSQFVAPIVSGTAWTLITEEIISGARAVCISQSGNLRVAMASVSGRMPAMGIVLDNVLSGIQANVYTQGLAQLSSGMMDYSGFLGKNVWVGRSGQVVSWSGSFNSGGFNVASGGDFTQRLGVIVNSGAFLMNVSTSTDQNQVLGVIDLIDAANRSFGF